MLSTLKNPTVKEQETAKLSVSSLRRITEVSITETTVTFQVKGESFEVPQKAVLIFEKVLEEMALGNSVEITSVEQELSTQEAADLIQVSRPHLVKLLDSGKIPSKLVGTHRRVKRSDVLKYEMDLKEIRRRNLEFLAKEAQEMKLGY